MPEISIIVPAYNSGHVISKCVNSILNQTFKDFELIIVDDGSTDRTGEVCNSFAVSDERVKVIHQTNSGVSAARNAGLDAAIGEYIIFVDSDDYIDADFIETLYKYKTDLTMCGFVAETMTGKLLYSVKHNFLKYGSKDQIDYGELYEKNLLYSPYCKLLSGRIIKLNSLRFPIEVNWGEDAMFIADYLQYVESVLVLEYDGYHYIKNENDSSLSTKLRYDIIEMIEKSRLYCIDKMAVTAPEWMGIVGRICEKDLKENCAYFVRKLLNAKGLSFLEKKKFLQKYMNSSFVLDTFKQRESFYFGRKDYLAALSKKNPTAILLCYSFEQYSKKMLDLFYRCWLVYKKITDRK